MVQSSATPSGTVTVSSIGPDFDFKKQVKPTGKVTLKTRKGKWAASLAGSDLTARDVKSLKDVVATLDYKAPKSITLNGKYELGTKKYTAGATWDGTVAKNATTLKLSYSNKDSLVAGDATVNVAKGQKVNCTFNQKQLLTAKYTYAKGDYTAEPSYSFVKQSPAVAVTRKLSAKDTLKLSYDIKSEGAAAEWNHKPFKMVLSSTVSKKLQVSRPTLAATFENVYEF